MSEATTTLSTNITPSETYIEGCPIYVVNKYVLPKWLVYWLENVTKRQMVNYELLIFRFSKHS